MNEVVPAPFRLSADGGLVRVYIGDELDTTLTSLDVLDEKHDGDLEAANELRFAVWSVLNTVQDSISEYTATPWPSVDGQIMALPGVRIDADFIHLWYGEHEGVPVIRIPPIRTSEISDERESG